MNLKKQLANPEYPAIQLAKALETAGKHEDEQTRSRARDKIAKWTSVLSGMASGVLNVGSRNPLAKTPSWVTLEVVTGGFATGRKAAAGPLQPHEEAMLTKLASANKTLPRRAINLFFLTDPGLQQLRQMYESGCYRISVPEEAALLVLLYLLDAGYQKEALALLNEIEPLLDELRFYPQPAETAESATDLVYLQSVGQARDKLVKVRDRDRITAQNEALNIWVPLYDQFVALVHRSLDGDAPQFASTDQPTLQTTTEHRIVGGKPFQRMDATWYRDAAHLLGQYHSLRRQHTRCAKPDRQGENFHDLRMFVGITCDTKVELSDRQIQRARLILARDAKKRGGLNSDRRRALRQWQQRDGRLPTRQQCAQLLRRRIGSLDRSSGIANPEQVLTTTIQEEEASLFDTDDVELNFPDSLARTIRRCLEATVEELVNKHVISSGDVLASILPQISARVLANQIADPRLARLYRSLYRAFRKRRSLLLLNLQKQVQFTELPWAKPIERARTQQPESNDASLLTLVEISRLTLRSFPYAIVPNKLLQEFRALAANADLALPLLDELAADIFAGEFTNKFLDAAQIAHDQLAGTVYANYFEFNSDALPWQSRRHVAKGFAELCAKRAGVSLRGFSVVANGRIIEQQQILTTQNLAALFTLPGLKEQLLPDLLSMTQHCFTWMMRELSNLNRDHHSKLIAFKNSAYAWRQSLFYLSHAPSGSAEVFIDWAQDQMRSESTPLVMRAAIKSLTQAAHGKTVENPMFLGWTSERWI